MTFWEYTSTDLPWLLTRPAQSAAMPEWMTTTFSNALDSMNTRLTTSSVGDGDSASNGQEAKRGHSINK
ncbi:hypothetical protein TNCV_3619381 [Trichonephila clavipes]|nr:hypothetical protein TNCV_3619381 [Trichonephila clavipes]